MNINPIPKKRRGSEVRSQIKELYDAGVQGTEIAKKLGVSRQHVYKLLQDIKGYKPKKKKIEQREKRVLSILSRNPTTRIPELAKKFGMRYGSFLAWVNSRPHLKILFGKGISETSD